MTDESRRQEIFHSIRDAAVLRKAAPRMLAMLRAMHLEIMTGPKSAEETHADVVLRLHALVDRALAGTEDVSGDLEPE